MPRAKNLLKWGIAPSGRESEIPASLAAFVEAERRRADLVGAALVAFDREGPCFARDCGYADLGRGEPVKPDTRFRAASVTKTLTAVLVLQDVAAGRLKLDAPANRWLEPPMRIQDVGGGLSGATIRHLLSHTSGLPTSWRGLLPDNPVVSRLLHGSLRLPTTVEEVLAGQTGVRPPGERFVYANGGFGLLGHIVARLAGRPLEDVARDRLFGPLGMRDSSLCEEHPCRPGLATPYAPGLGEGAGRKPAPVIHNLTGGAGTLVTTARDLARFGGMLLRGGELDGTRVVDGGLLAEAMRLHVQGHPDLDDGWGLGFEVSPFRGRRCASHGGSMPGVATRLTLLPDDGVGVVLLANGGSWSFVGAATNRTLETLLNLEPEAVPGGPVGIPSPLRDEWNRLTGRVVGRWRAEDAVPPGIVGRILGALARPRIEHVADGVLALQGVTERETILLYPDGDVGRYRVAWPLLDGARAVIVERDDGAHLWMPLFHMRKPR
jgi:CubicO group peptidase (beta-lactamase class C family)